MRILTKDDFVETYLRVQQRSLKYIISKFDFSQENRAKSTFNEPALNSANYWIIPEVRERWNHKVTGKSDQPYEHYVMENYLASSSSLDMISLGSGICSHELEFAKYEQFHSVKCIDFSDKLLDKARSNAEGMNLKNITFEVADVNRLTLPSNVYDVVLFHSALHHFKNVPYLLDQVKQSLKENGLLIINEYVGPNRLQIKTHQIETINHILKNELPVEYRKRFKTNLTKRSVSGPGWLRMLVNDPSEAVESEGIMAAIHERFSTVEEKPLGGDLLMFALKDIAHHFVNDSGKTKSLLERIFELEDKYVAKYGSDFMFGVFQKPGLK